MIMIALMAALADGVTTYLILRRGGRELNPLLRVAIRRLGLVQGLIVTKFFTFIATAATIGTMGGALFLAIILVYGLVIANNLRQLRPRT